MMSFYSLQKLLFGLTATGAIALTGSGPVLGQTVLSSFSTGGADMNGMEITVNWLGGGSETQIWGTTGYNAGGAFGRDWSLSFVGSTTFGIPWNFTNTGASIASLTIHGVPGNTVFDTHWPTFPGTPGSANGWTFQPISGQDPTVFEYGTPIDISVGDVFGSLSLFWDQGFTGTLRFYADTDNGTIENPVTPLVSKSVPEPSLLLGLVALGVMGTVIRKH
ncbi:PEP-CTERM sorting domain-containing protein [Spirulina subsalsa FACHB-351]|uniref:PEP-CTERM sorting domain-containing protein n=1 Tax=Spirulina subsalsa FACHB-351 TaxID=234711 RepID=A0ABT3L114_9CYAN|nr:PEP-CTERM sorting domain-containing protein [Spirulina subsalsa]MCW6035175.1 PEP-CTERM sorting domain-containing protein [Spirulina subsalsa FACHB-351]